MFECRSCGGSKRTPVIDLGATPLANALIAPDRSHSLEPRYPLQVVFCQDCSLVQITETVSPELLFSDYVYFSSVSATAVASARQLAERLVVERRLNAGSLVIEAASNDGYLLRHYRDRGIAVLGIEPAANIARIAEVGGIPTRCAFFGREEAARLVATDGRKCDVFHANNVLAHVPDLNGFVVGLRTILAGEGVAVIEVPYLRDLIDKSEFDTIYHEHLCYFSVTALHRLLSRHQLVLADIERIPIHGGSLRLFVMHEGAAQKAAVARLLEQEEKFGVTHTAYYADFAARIENLRSDLVSLLKDLKGRGHSIAAYGASAKGTTLLNFFGLGRDVLDFVADRSPVKQGKLTPGLHLPIVPADALARLRPDYCLLLTWNFAEEILQQQSGYRAGGGKFVVPIPQVRIV
jgi:SAM-dependent methyltransferase